MNVFYGEYSRIGKMSTETVTFFYFKRGECFLEGGRGCFS